MPKMLTMDDRFEAIVADVEVEAKIRPFQEPDPDNPVPAEEKPAEGTPVEEKAAQGK